MDVYLREGGRLLTGKRFVSLTQTETACPPQSPRASSSSAPTRLSRAAVTATFEDGTTVAAQLLVGADGARSRVRACLYGEECLRYSGASCWRGFIPECPSALRATDAAQRQCMYKTVSHPNGFGASFTCGWTTRQRCFWVLDVNYPKVCAVCVCCSSLSLSHTHTHTNTLLCLSVCLSVSLSVCLSVCLCLSLSLPPSPLSFCLCRSPHRPLRCAGHAV